MAMTGGTAVELVAGNIGRQLGDGIDEENPERVQQWQLDQHLAIWLAASIQTGEIAHNSRKFAFKLLPINCGYWKAMIHPFLVTNV
ncbi:hypothetical protein R6Q59_028003 [Mikania micrantha]